YSRDLRGDAEPLAEAQRLPCLTGELHGAWREAHHDRGAEPERAELLAAQDRLIDIDAAQLARGAPRDALGCVCQRDVADAGGADHHDREEADRARVDG